MVKLVINHIKDFFQIILHLKYWKFSLLWICILIIIIWISLPFIAWTMYALWWSPTTLDSIIIFCWTLLVIYIGWYLFSKVSIINIEKNKIKRFWDIDKKKLFLLPMIIIIITIISALLTNWI